MSYFSDALFYAINTFLFICFLGIFCFGCSQLNKKLGLPDDNIAEELLEEVVEAKTGLDIDLTPSSEET